MIDFDQVRLVDVSRHFGRRRAVSHITFSAQTGDIVGLLGPNGAGKSTLIAMLATLIAPSSGQIRYGEQDARTLGLGLRSRIGLLAHELYLYPELSARQNLMLFAQLYGIEARHTVDEALANAGLADRADDDVSGFSRGMRQRLALERALLHRPKLVLLDEPFTGLDDRAATTVAERLTRLAADGAIIVLATHDLDIAGELATRAVIVRDGRLASDEPGGSDLRHRYRATVGRA